MSDRAPARRLSSIIGALVAVAFLVLAATIVFRGCNSPDDRGQVISPADDGVGAPGTAE